jgi:hypothetical protein
LNLAIGQYNAAQLLNCLQRLLYSPIKQSAGKIAQSTTFIAIQQLAGINSTESLIHLP